MRIGRINASLKIGEIARLALGPTAHLRRKVRILQTREECRRHHEVRELSYCLTWRWPCIRMLRNETRIPSQGMTQSFPEDEVVQVDARQPHHESHGVPYFAFQHLRPSPSRIRLQSRPHE